jgi:hypothetical protein
MLSTSRLSLGTRCRLWRRRLVGCNARSSRWNNRSASSRDTTGFLLGLRCVLSCGGVQYMLSPYHAATTGASVTPYGARGHGRTCRECAPSKLLLIFCWLRGRAACSRSSDRDVLWCRYTNDIYMCTYASACWSDSYTSTSSCASALSASDPLPASVFCASERFARTACERDERLLGYLKWPCGVDTPRARSLREVRLQSR